MLPLLLQVGFSLMVVLMLMWGAARLVRRPFGARGSGRLAVLGTHQLGRGSSVAVVRVGGRALVLGITDQQVNLLAEADLAAFETAPGEEHIAVDVEDGRLPGRHSAGSGGRLAGSILSPRTWISTLEFLRDRTTRPDRTGTTATDLTAR